LLSQDPPWSEGGNGAPHFFKIRRAKATDQAEIRALIRNVGINPLGLDWRRFYLAVDHDNQLVGCGQIKVHKDGSRELASIAVKENWRRLGIASRLIETLLHEVDGNVWLMCRSEMVPFYKKFGFIEVLRLDNLPSYFRRIASLWRMVSKIFGRKRKGSIMVKKQ